MTAQDGHAETSPPAASDRPADPAPEQQLILPSADEVRDYAVESAGHGRMSRRTLLRVGAVGAGAVAVTAGRALAEPYLAQRGLLSTDGVLAAASGGLSDLIYIEAFPTSPLIVSPFSDPLPIPKALAPVAKSVYSRWAKPPGPGVGQQNSMGNRAASDLAETDRLSGPDRVQDRPAGPAARLHHVAGAADRRQRPADRFVRRFRQDLPGGHPAEPPAEHDLRLQRHLPGTADQRRIRQAGARPVREPPRREPVEPRPAGLRFPGLVVPDPPAQRAHRAGERRQPALLDAVRPEGPGLPAADVGATTCI